MIEIKKFIFNPIDVNCYIIWDESKEAVLIDAAVFYEKEKEELKRFILENKLNIKHHLNTHLHFDHIFGNNFVEKEFNIKAEANDGDWAWAENISERIARFGLKYNDAIQPLGRILKDGDNVYFGNHVIAVIHVPGHSPGSLTFYIEKENILFSGDALFQRSIGRTDLADGDFNTLINSIKNKLLTLPDDTIVYPGHGNSTTIDYEKHNNSFLI